MCYIGIIRAMKTIKQYREEASLTQQEVMTSIGMLSRSNYSKVENRKQKPRPDARRKIAKLFKVKPSEIEW
jgi:transcriptional regulator with XRE-family HTH domain